MPLSRGLARGLGSGLGQGLAYNESGGWTPLPLFAAGEKGGWWDPSNLASVWEDSAGTVPASVDGVVGKINDLSGNSFHFLQATTANKPILRLASGKYYLEFDGADDFMSCASFDLSGTPTITGCVGARKTSDAAATILLELTTSTSTQAGSFFFSGSTSGTAAWAVAQRATTGAATVSRVATTYTQPITNVLYCLYSTAASGVANELTVRINAATPGTLTNSGTDSGTGNFANATLYMGRRAGTTLPYTGRIYQAVLVGADKSANRDDLETFVNLRTGAY